MAHKENHKSVSPKDHPLPWASDPPLMSLGTGCHETGTFGEQQPRGNREESVGDYLAIQVEGKLSITKGFPLAPPPPSPKIRPLKRKRSPSPLELVDGVVALEKNYGKAPTKESVKKLRVPLSVVETFSV